MMLAARNIFLAARRKPALPYDAEVEWLESTGTQWIDTGVNISDDNYVLSCTMMSTSSTQTAWARYFGSYTSESAASTRLVAYNTNGREGYVGYRRASSSQNSAGYAVSFTAARRFVLSYGSLVAYNADGTYYASWTLRDPSGGTDTSTVKVFGAKMRVWGFHITHNAVLVRDLVPVRFTNEQGQSEGAMYDRLGTGGMNPDGSARTDGLYRNRGTGAFTIGPDKEA